MFIMGEKLGSYREYKALISSFIMAKTRALISHLEQRIANQTFHTKVSVQTDNADRGKVEIKWTYQLDTREWGIKSIMPVVPDQTIRVKKKDGEGFETGDEEIHLKNVEVVIYGGESNSISLAPETVKVKDGKVKVVFNS